MKNARPLLIVGLLLTACAAGVSAEKVSATEASIRAAEEVGAPKVPQASLHLQLAKEERERAQGFIRDGNTPDAEGLLMRAQADAELAVALAREAGMRTEAQQEMEKARGLQQRDGR
jgi:hypothetical protein